MVLFSLNQSTMFLFRCTALIFLASASGIAKSTPLVDEDFDEYEFMNLSADPCEDFYEYSCGNFRNLYPLGEGQVVIDQFSLLEAKLTEIVVDILKDDIRQQDPKAVKKAKMAYGACIDYAYMDSRDLLAPEVKVVKEYGGFPILKNTHIEGQQFGWNEIGSLAADFGINIFFTPSLYYDTQNASRNILRISNDEMDIPTQFRTSLPDSYERAIEEGFEELAKAPNRTEKETSRTRLRADVPQMEILLRKLVMKLKRQLGSQESVEYLYDRVANISNFMIGIHFGGYMVDGTEVEPLSESMVTLRELNEWTIKSFGTKIKLDWVEYVRSLLQHTYVEVNEDFQVLNPGNDFHIALYKIINWVAMNDPAIVQSAALLRVFVYMAADSDQETRNDFVAYLQAIGKPVYERTEYCARKIMDASGTLSLGLAVAHDYQKKYFDTPMLLSAAQLIEDLKESFKLIIEETEWMDDYSKEAAQEKADNIVTLLAYPEFITDEELLDEFFDNLPMNTWNHFENAKNLRSFQQAYTLSLISKRDRKAWEKSPFDANAYYNRPNNRIIFPVAMLNPIFFKGSKSLIDYSRIGMIVAHEITHGFDSQGWYYNQEGVIAPWWSALTQTNFDEQTQCFVEQYSSYFVPEINSTISGEGGLNENLADNGGLRTAYKAVKKRYSTAGPSIAPNGFSIDQMFFVGYGTMWCNTEAVSYLNDLRTTCVNSKNCHFPSKWRVNGVVSNMVEFAEAFSCPAGSPMNPQTKCRLW